MAPGERGGALPRSSVCPVNRAISCFNKLIYWEYFRFSVVSQGALSQRAIGPSGRRKATRQTTRRGENTQGRVPAGVGKIWIGDCVGRALKGDPVKGDGRKECRSPRSGTDITGGRPYRKKVTQSRAHQRGNRWLGGAWRRDDPRKGRSFPCKGRADGRQPQGRVARGMSARERAALRMAGPGNCGLGKGELRKDGLTKGRPRR